MVPLVLLVLTVVAVVDALSRSAEKVRLFPPPVWAVIALVPLVGPLAWFHWGRPRRERRPVGRVMGPDDDDEFLRRL